MDKINQMKSVTWSNGKVSGVVYHGNDKYRDFLVKVFSKFAWANPLHFDLFPRVRNMEIEIIKMARNMFQGNNQVCGNVTYGGTESILLACKAYRDWGFYEKGITNPNIVILDSGHSAFHKAGNYFKINIKTVPTDHTGTSHFRIIEKYIDSNTVCIVGSTPSYAHGIIDPIEKMSYLAQYYKIGLHVDCCMGGFLMPFVRDKLGIKYDFSLNGVTSISADTHKYGYTFKGSSIILYKNPSYKKHQHFSQSDWNGGIYATPTIMGSKSGALIATAWAAMLYHGKERYTEIANKILELTNKIVDHFKGNHFINVIGKPKLNIIAFKSKVINIYALSSSLTDKGWHLNILQNPSSFHFCVTNLHVQNETIIDDFLKDIDDSVLKIRDGKYNNVVGTAALYGMASNISHKSVTKDIVDSYIDLLSNDNICN